MTTGTSRPDIMTASGRYFNFLHPELSPLSIEDVAHALSHLCRYTGHVREFYSVAQHAVMCSYIVAPEFAFEALHHDDAEAVLGDVSRPLKQLLPEYKALERKVEAVLRQRLGLPAIEAPEVKHADLVMLATEKRDLMPRAPEGATVVYEDLVTGEVWQDLAGPESPWACIEGIEPLADKLTAWTPQAARAIYLDRHYELLAERTRRAA